MLFEIVKIHASMKLIFLVYFLRLHLFASASFINEAMSTKEHVCIEFIITMKRYGMLPMSLV